MGGAHRPRRSTWSWEMPRINDDLLDCVIYLYPTVEDARSGYGAGGSGFLASVPSLKYPDRWYRYAITNAHVVAPKDDKKPAPVIRLNTRSGDTEVIPV